MTSKWYDSEAAREWINSEVNGEKYKQVQKVLNDELTMNLAACCTAAYEGYKPNELNKRISQILSSTEDREDAAMFLVYHQAVDTPEAKKLLQKQHLNNHPIEKTNAKKENNMNEQQAEKPLTGKQVDLAMRNKERVLKEVEEFKQYLQKQDNPQWWLKRRFFSFAANSFNKLKRDSFQAKSQQNPVENKPSIDDNIPKPSTNQSSGQKI